MRKRTQIDIQKLCKCLPCCKKDSYGSSGMLESDTQAMLHDKTIDQSMRLDLVYLTTAGIREAALRAASQAKGYPGEAQEQKQFLHLYGQPYYSMKVVMEKVSTTKSEEVENAIMEDPEYVNCLDQVIDAAEGMTNTLQNLHKASERNEEELTDRDFSATEATFFDFAPEEFTKLRNALNIRYMWRVCSICLTMV